jgi:xanthine dehydrogenase accessory factor
VVAQALRTPAGYIGMIGSRRKIGLTWEVLRAQGFSDEDLARVHAPIGLDIGGDTPGEIAVSVMAQLIMMRRKGGAGR